MRVRHPWLLLSLFVTATACAVVVGVLAHDAADARGDLRQAERSIDELQTAILAGDDRTASRALTTAQDLVLRARSHTTGLAWHAATAVPFLGRTPRMVRTLTVAADDLARFVLPELVSARSGFAFAPPGGVDLAALAGAAARFRAADDALRRVHAVIGHDPTSGVLPEVEAARASLVARVGELQRRVQAAADALPVAARMLGADGPRRYFLAVQNNAEARGTGGLVGAFAIVEADHGRVRVVHVGSDEELTRGAAATGTPVVDFGSDYRTLYSDDPAIWQNSNESPHFPYAAQLWLQMWRAQTGQSLDGAVAIDPTAAGYVLRVAGPVRMPDGELVTADNVVEKTQRDAYVRFADDNSRRKDYLVQFARVLFRHVLDARPDVGGVLDALGRATGENRLLVYSVRADEQAVLARTAIAGELPDGSTRVIEVAVVNGSGGKLDYYLDRRVAYTSSTCERGRRSGELRVDLHTALPAQPLPAYVVDRHDAHADGAATGSSRLLVFVYLAGGTTPTAVTLDDRPVTVAVARERGHPVVALPVELSPGHHSVLRVQVTGPAAVTAPVVRVQPLVRPQETAVTFSMC